MKKILFYTDTPLVGGAELQMLLLAQYINKEKYEISLACSAFPALDNWCKQFTSVHRINVLHKHDPRHFVALRQLLRENRYDLVHIHLWNPAACRYAFLCRTPFLITEHDPFPLSPLKEFVRKKLIKNTRAIIAISKANQTFLEQRDPELREKIITIYNGIDLDAWEKQLAQCKDKITFRAEQFHAEPKDFIILNVATLHKRKGQDILIRAFATVQKTIPQARLVLVGDGPSADEFKQLANTINRDRIVFLGKRDDIAHIMKSSDLFVLPSRREAFGFVLLEAMASSLPIVATSVGGVPEIIQDGADGRLVKPNDEVLLAQALIALITNESQRAQFAKTAFTKVHKAFSAQKMAEETELVYDKILISKDP